MRVLLSLAVAAGKPDHRVGDPLVLGACGEAVSNRRSACETWTAHFGVAGPNTPGISTEGARRGREEA